MKALDLLGWAVVHASWQALIIGGAAAVALRFPGSSPRMRYTITFSSLLLTAVTPIATAFVIAAAQMPAIGQAGIAGSSAVVQQGTDTPFPLPPTRWIALAWLTCVVVLLLRWFGGWWLIIQVRRRGTRPARAPWDASLRALASRMGVTAAVELLESSLVDTPTVIGHRRAVVLLPVPAFESLAAAEAESVLAHELAHVRRRDFVANGVQTVVEMLLFFHPVVHWLSRRVREERELCCDDAAIEATSSRLVYVRALAHLETLRVSLRGSRLALGASGGTLLRRIQHLATTAEPIARAGGGSRIAVSVTLLSTLAVLATVGSLVVPPTLHAIALANPVDPRYTVSAFDPAGAFTITFVRGRPVSATVDGVAVGRERLVTRRDSVFIPWPGRAGSFAVRMKANGFTWSPRQRP